MIDNNKYSKKKQTNSSLAFVDDNEEEYFDESDFVQPDTLFSPKDKVSNATWNNKLPIGEDIGVITARKPTIFGCIVHLDYEKIINSPDVVTGAELSPFDRTVYDAVVTIFVAGNDTFTTADLWHIISQNPKAKLTEKIRDKIIKSMFHISRFWMSIVTDESEKSDAWIARNINSAFKSERKFYKNLRCSYTGRLIDFRVIAYRSFNTTYSENGKIYTEHKDFADIWKIGFPPILYQYAKAKGQVSSVPLHLLDTSKKENKKIALNRGDHTDELTNFLSREIDTMKKTSKRKQPYSRFILLDKIYKIDGIDDIEQTNNNIWTKKKTTRQKLEKILQRFKENGMIKGHTFHKKVKGKSLTFHSVEINF